MRLALLRVVICTSLCPVSRPLLEGSLHTLSGAGEMLHTASMPCLWAHWDVICPQCTCVYRLQQRTVRKVHTHAFLETARVGNVGLPCAVGSVSHALDVIEFHETIDESPICSTQG